MGLIQEATQMLSQGIGLVAQEFITWDDGEGASSLRSTVLRRVVHSGGDVFYEVVDYRKSLNGELHRFDEPTQAAHTFARLVGRSALSRAVAAHRYAYLFPRGSSLDWHRSRRKVVPLRSRRAA